MNNHTFINTLIASFICTFNSTVKSTINYYLALGCKPLVVKNLFFSSLYPMFLKMRLLLLLPLSKRNLIVVLIQEIHFRIDLLIEGVVDVIKVVYNSNKNNNNVLHGVRFYELHNRPLYSKATVHLR